MQKLDELHPDRSTLVNNPIDTKWSICSLKTLMCACRVVYGLDWTGLASSFRRIDTFAPYHLPFFPRKRFFTFVNTPKNRLFCSGFNLAWLLATSLKSASSYLLDFISARYVSCPLFSRCVALLHNLRRLLFPEKCPIRTIGTLILPQRICPKLYNKSIPIFSYRSPPIIQSYWFL